MKLSISWSERLKIIRINVEKGIGAPAETSRQDLDGSNRRLISCSFHHLPDRRVVCANPFPGPSDIHVRVVTHNTNGERCNNNTSERYIDCFIRTSILRAMSVAELKSSSISSSLRAKQSEESRANCMCCVCTIIIYILISRVILV